MAEDVRLVNVPTTEGFVAEWLTGEQRAVVSQLVHAAHHYRDTGETDRLEALQGVTVGSHTLETDPTRIEVLFGEDAGDFEFYLDNESDDE
jgi:hypothetical protein